MIYNIFKNIVFNNDMFNKVKSYEFDVYYIWSEYCSY